VLELQREVVPKMKSTIAKKSAAPEDRICSNCSAREGSASASKLSACARCGLVMYCSRDCQRAHWKANHKQYCIAKADRAPQQQSPLDAHTKPAPGKAAEGGNCAICQDLLSEASATTLPCNHVFHKTCVAELRNIGVNEVCPLCRRPLPPGPEKVFDEAARRFVAVHELVVRGKATWSTLPERAQLELDAVVSEWHIAAEQGLAAAQFNLGQLYGNGHGVVQNYKEAANWYKKAADQGYAPAQHNFGRMLSDGCGVAQSHPAALEWYTKAANQGMELAQFTLGCIFAFGRGVAQNREEAARWFRLAAEQGHATAQLNLGIQYLRGQGVTKNKKEAFRWYEMAAHQGDTKAQCLVANNYEKGGVVARSYSKAAQWWRKAADQGVKEAQHTLANYYTKGLGVVQSNSEAARWFEKAAEQGVVKAQYTLGIMYECDIGVAQNDKKARYWYEKAAAQGHKGALTQLEGIDACELAEQTGRGVVALKVDGEMVYVAAPKK